MTAFSSSPSELLLELADSSPRFFPSFFGGIFSLRSAGGGVGQTFTMCPVPWHLKQRTSSVQSRARWPVLKHLRHLVSRGVGATPCSLRASITPSVTIATRPLTACSAALAAIFGLFGAPKPYFPWPAPYHCLFDIFQNLVIKQHLANYNSQFSTVLHSNKQQTDQIFTGNCKSRKLAPPLSCYTDYGL